MNSIGSPEWFKDEASKYEEFQKEIENLRYRFLDRFAPDKLSQMSAVELLNQVFENNKKSMMHLLIKDKSYNEFAPTGNSADSTILYKTNDCSWKYRKNTTVTKETFSDEVAKVKATEITNLLIKATQIIEDKKPSNVEDYKELNDELSSEGIFFYQRNWAMKYFQMVFPYYFPGMHAGGKKGDSLKTLDRALDKLGIETKPSDVCLVKAGMVSLFIRNCDINNIVFNKIYEKIWGWKDSDKPFSKSIKINNNKYINANTREINKKLYKFPLRKDEKIKEANDIDAYINTLQLKGEEKYAMIRTRVNQSVFRDNLISKYGKCCICGIDNEKLLIASHIKPWSVSEPEEKLEADNGFLFCPNHDKLFDKGYISFNDDGSILISNKIDDENKRLLNISQEIKITLNENNKKYLQYHRDNIFDKGYHN